MLLLLLLPLLVVLILLLQQLPAACLLMLPLRKLASQPRSRLGVLLSQMPLDFDGQSHLDCWESSAPGSSLEQTSNRSCREGRPPKPRVSGSGQEWTQESRQNCCRRSDGQIPRLLRWESPTGNVPAACCSSTGSKSQVQLWSSNLVGVTNSTPPDWLEPSPQLKWDHLDLVVLLLLSLVLLSLLLLLVLLLLRLMLPLWVLLLLLHSLPLLLLLPVLQLVLQARFLVQSQLVVLLGPLLLALLLPLLSLLLLLRPLLLLLLLLLPLLVLLLLLLRSLLLHLLLLRAPARPQPQAPYGPPLAVLGLPKLLLVPMLTLMSGPRAPSP